MSERCGGKTGRGEGPSGISEYLACGEGSFSVVGIRIAPERGKA